jgi:Icc-related predicted phosphoesterase
MFQRFWVCCGAYGNRDSMSLLRQAATTRRADALLFAGGIVAIPRHYRPGETSEWSLTLDDTRFIEEFFSTLGGLGIFSAAVHGPTGAPLEEFLRLGMQAELAYPTVHFVHATLVEAGGLAFCGIGGSVAEGQLLGTDCYTRTTAEYALRPLWNTKQPRKVLLLPSPPPGPLGGPEGDPLVRELIDNFHPDLCVVTGKSERRGSERIGTTLIINPGCLADGWAVWLDWNLPAQDQVEFVNLRA